MYSVKNLTRIISFHPEMSPVVNVFFIHLIQGYCMEKILEEIGHEAL